MEQYDVVCFHPHCVRDQKQLFSSGDSNNYFHYSYHDECCIPIHQGHVFFKNLKIPPINLPESQEASLASFRQKH